jgi:6-pyruvoyl-tetrahydropterin synthase
MPLPVQEVVTARLSTEGTDEEIGERLGLTGEEVRELIAQGQAILDRSLALDFTIRYIAISEVVDADEPEPEFPSFDEDYEQIDEDDEFEHDERTSDLGQLIANSVDSLARASVDERTDDDSKKTLSEVLREAGNLFRLASERLRASSPPESSLRAAMADTRDDDESITLVVENPGDVTPLMMALQAADSVRVAQLESVTTETAVFRLSVSSMMELVRELMSHEGRLRPARLQTAGDEVTIELPVVDADVHAGATGAVSHPSGEQYELSVDSFFGARHFIESGDNVGPPHHHSYRVEAGFVSAQPDRQGFVLGFAHVRELVESTVMDYSETLLNTEDPFLELPPTTENLAKVFHQKITGKLRESAQASVQLKHVRVWESPSNSATYTDFGSDAAITA